MRERFSSALVPLALYWAVGLGLPVLDGAASRPEFRAHALNTVLVSGAIALAWIAWRRRASPTGRGGGTCLELGGVAEEIASRSAAPTSLPRRRSETRGRALSALTLRMRLGWVHDAEENESGDERG